MPEPESTVDVPSLEVVEQALEAQEISYRERAAALDRRAGFGLTLAGVIIGFVGRGGSPFEVIAQGFALFAAGIIVWYLTPAFGAVFSPKVLFYKYLLEPEVTTRIAALQSRIKLHEAAEERARRTGKAVRVVYWLLLAALTALFVASIIDAV